MQIEDISYGERVEVDPDILAKLRSNKATAAAILSMLGPTCVLRGGAIRGMYNGRPFAGPAVTVGVTEIDHRTVLRAAELAQEGDVIVIAADGETRQAIWGIGLNRTAVASGVAAVVVDGVISNTGDIAEMDLPVYALGANPATGVWVGTGTVNRPISIDGLTIRAGDIIAGDSDGVVVIPIERAAEIADGVEAYSANLETIRTRLAAGEKLSELARR